MSRETDYNEKKTNQGLRITNTSWRGWNRLAADLGIPRSEVIERIGRISTESDEYPVLIGFLKMLFVKSEPKD